VWQYHARILLHTPLAVAAERIGPEVGILEPVDDQRCELRTGADTLPVLAVYLGFLEADFEVLEPPELVEHVHELGERYRRAATPGREG
jgi:hypothetical protein